jgi:flagellin-specific chaperone FliS
MEKQERLIDMLYDEASATPEMREMKEEIDRERHRLEDRPLSKIVNISRQ